jgi:solute:Na+ symporter, SSS family
MTAFSARLDPIDWIAIAFYMLSVVVIGWWYSRRNRSGGDYLVGGRKMNPITVGLSFFVALFSTISYLAIPGEIVRYGPIVFSGLLAYPIVLFVVGWFIIPSFMKLNVNSGYELLETRLGVVPRIMGVALFLLMRLMWMAVIVYATVDKVLVPLIGLTEAATPLLCIALAGLTIVYTTMGGLKAIVTVDVIQAILLFGGVLVSLGLITYKLGGVQAWWPDTWPAHWPEANLVGGGDRTLVAALVSSLVWYTCTAGSDQMAVQRYLATRDVSGARKMLAVSLISSAFIKITLSCLGLALMAYVAANPSWLPGGALATGAADKLFPRFIATTLPAGFAGLIIAGLLAEAMNSLSSGMNAASAVIGTDLVGRFRRRKMEAAQELRLLRWISLLVGTLVVLLSAGVGHVQGNLLELIYKVVNLLTAPLFSLFFMAIFIPWATAFGAVAGAVSGIAVAVLINYWRELAALGNHLFNLQLSTEPMLSFLWGTPLSLVVAALVGMLVSLLPTGPTAAQQAIRLRSSPTENPTPSSVA